MKMLASNKKAFFDYEVLEKMLAGIVLLGCEIKSLRQSKVNLKGSYITLKNGELWLKKMHISPYPFSSDPIDPLRDRKLLLKKREIAKIERKLSEQGITCVPLEIGLVKNLAKVEIALVRGKKKYDKRESLKKKDIERDLSRKLKKSR